tara:strand:- start:5734 stop:7293 length:1560 start_codon:yes stop_codon:yes gene_type:complete
MKILLNNDMNRFYYNRNWKKDYRILRKVGNLWFKHGFDFRIKVPLRISTLVYIMLFTIIGTGQELNLKAITTFNVGTTIGQLRAVPVNLSYKEKAILIVYSEEKSVDPYVKMFFLPKNTLKLALYSYEGKLLWKKELPKSLLPGHWFSPVYPLDMDGDGMDEIYMTNNTDLDHPFNASAYVLEKLNVRTGETLMTKPWKPLGINLRLSHQFRYYVFGGQVNGKSVLVTATGTYSDMRLESWDSNLDLRWELEIPKGKDGARASHMTPVFDLDWDGNDEFMWGERCISMDTGKYKFIADEDVYWGHSDIIQPVWDEGKDKWYIYTCRETGGFSPRVVLFDGNGERVWSDLEEGHMDMGWCARLGTNGEKVSMSIRIGKKVAGSNGFYRSNNESFIYDTFSGKKIDPPYPVFSTLPVDFNGDGIHELVCAYGEQGDGKIYNNNGKVIGDLGKEYHIAIGSKFMDFSGEQILVYSPEGNVKIYRDLNANDNKKANSRYSSSFYERNQRLTASGSNIINLGGF